MNDIHTSSLYDSFPLPLNSRCIRLLEVQPDLCSEETGPIHANFHVVNLDEQPVFSALSYVWGTDTHLRTIVCASSVVKVTENCHSALQSLRKKLEKFTIWIDALCINQDDQAEKVQQIMLMERIYSGAKIVYIWLGEGNEQSDRAIAYLGRAGLLEYFSPDIEPIGYKSTKSQVSAAVWYTITSLMVTTNHPFPVAGKFY